jgi:ABC-type multidrug transport system ATPase subunit
MNAIEAGHLFKRFGTVTAVNDVSLTVREGETFGFLGPNGAGKTTTIRLLTGVLTPDSGTVHITVSTSTDTRSMPRCRWVLFRRAARFMATFLRNKTCT